MQFRGARAIECAAGGVRRNRLQTRCRGCVECALMRSLERVEARDRRWKAASARTTDAIDPFDRCRSRTATPQLPLGRPDAPR